MTFKCFNHFLSFCLSFLIQHLSPHFILGNYKNHEGLRLVLDRYCASVSTHSLRYSIGEYDISVCGERREGRGEQLTVTPVPRTSSGPLRRTLSVTRRHVRSWSVSKNRYRIGIVFDWQQKNGVSVSAENGVLGLTLLNGQPDGQTTCWSSPWQCISAKPWCINNIKHGSVKSHVIQSNMTDYKPPLFFIR